jgi:hypothetical protein
MSLRQAMRRLARSRSGVAMTEFALGAPFLLMAGLWGTEVANYALVNMKVGQLAVHIADNASRIGDTSTLQNRKIFEEDINDLLLGANIQGGGGLDLYEHGRVIVSSLEIWDQSSHCNPSGNCPSGSQSNGVQFIHWQRCKGVLSVSSNYGNENQAKPNGLGPAGQEVYASEGNPVIFVELQYDYQPLISDRFLGSTRISSTAAFMVRDHRDLLDVFKRNESTPIADCDLFTSFPAT